jgi:hypothetical protein
VTRRRLYAVPFGVIVVGLLCLTAMSGQTTSAGYLAKVTNSVNTAATASYFTCAAAVTADASSAIFAYVLSESSGAKNAADYSGHKLNGSYKGAMTTNLVAPACSRDAGGAYVLDGSTSYLTTTTLSAPTNVFTEEIWFKTNVAGGKLIGWGGASTGQSTTYDRHLYIAPTGQVVFGVYDGATQTVVSPLAYTDGKWHQAAATLSPAGMNLYLDGNSVGTNPGVTTAEAINGCWRIGYDNITNWGPTTPANFFFNGSLRFAAVYNTALTAAQIKAHYAAGL